MKKILALLLAITMIAAFCACAQKPADTTPADTSADTAAETTTDTAAETPADTAAETPAASDGALI